MATLILKNNTASVVTIADVGATILGSGQDTYDDMMILLELSSSSDLRGLVTDGTLTVNDGTDDLSISDGLIYLSTLWSRAGSDEVPVVPGSQGAQGVIGTQGFQGNVGIQGSQGIGIQGAQGITGSQGIQGAGPQGAQGAIGEQGIQGAIGPQGFQGLIGPQGFQGLIGPQGFQGLL